MILVNIDGMLRLTRNIITSCFKSGNKFDLPFLRSDCRTGLREKSGDCSVKNRNTSTAICSKKKILLIAEIGNDNLGESNLHKLVCRHNVSDEKKQNCRLKSES